MRAVSSRSSAAHSVPAIVCRVCASAEELEAHHELRRAVFVREQRLFAFDDRDEHDARPHTLHAVGLLDGEPCGAVRLYPLDAAGLEWKGDRLAVLRGLRSHHLGAELVRFAVATAGELGGERMIAHVQLANVRFFEHLGWRAQGAPGSFHGADHQLMWTPLEAGGAARGL